MNPRFLFAFALALTAGAALAHDYRLADLHILDPYARPTVPSQPTGAAFLTIENKGSAADKLVAVSTTIAKSVEIHTMAMEGNVMTMREVQSIELKPATKIAMRPGQGYHLMLFGLHQQLKAGDTFSLTLTFEKAGKTNVTVSVGNREAAKEGAMPNMQH